MGHAEKPNSSTRGNRPFHSWQLIRLQCESICSSVRFSPQLGLLLGSALAFDVVLHVCTHRANPGGFI
ncbi:hypothetical protein NSPZN2_20005 [Nitrospira defluvii]|uniref:Uncharacterized protein n=1 Tax=Nitrospira defluvii TaxID=330214 RepID=A0ABN7LED2_9BACT|nr:hypothetical protein NSPZN2_20005 [Nitrospira defluvii]